MNGSKAVRLIVLGTAMASLAVGAWAQTSAPPAPRQPGSKADLESQARQVRPGQLGADEVRTTPTPDAPAEPTADGIEEISGLVLEVTGRVSWKAAGDDTLRPLAVHDVVKPGSVISTGIGGSVVIRIGTTATVRVNPQARVTFAQLLEGDTKAKTTLALERGDMDVRVDRDRKENDFAVVTPTATLAVKGTEFNVLVDAVDGTRVTGVSTNDLRAIEITYANARPEAAMGRGLINDFSSNAAENAIERTAQLAEAGNPRAEFATRLAFPLFLDAVAVTTSREALLVVQTLDETIEEFADDISDANSLPPFGGGGTP